MPYVEVPPAVVVLRPAGETVRVEARAATMITAATATKTEVLEFRFNSCFLGEPLSLGYYF